MSAGHIFLSYCSDDKRFAEELVRGLESGGLRIWFAPRDVRPGIDYSEQIQAAIESATAFVVIISEASNESDFVRAETEMAFSRRRPIFPLRTAPVVPAPGLALFLQLRHWTDAFGRNRQNATARLGEELTGLSQSRGGRRGRPSLFRRNRASAGETHALSGGRGRAVLLLAVSGCAGLVLFAFLLLRGDPGSSAHARGDAPPMPAGNAAAPQQAPGPGQPDYDPVMASWLNWIIITTPPPPPPPEENLAIDSGTAGTTGNATDPGKDVTGM